MENNIQVDPKRLRSKSARKLYSEIFQEKEVKKRECKQQQNRQDKSKMSRPMSMERTNNIHIPTDQADYSPGIEDILDFYEHNGLVGEESTSILQTFAAIKRMSFGIESLSGSGKSFSANLLMKLLPEEYVYRMELSSNTAEMYNADEINKAKLIYIPELQKALKSRNTLMIEILKNLSEGRDAIRKVRDQEKRETITLHITADKGIIYTLASENEFKKDAELSRRFFQLSTDTSEEQTSKVIQSIVENEYTHKIGKRDFSKLKQHVRECLELSDLTYINPFSEKLLEITPLTVKARSFVRHYLDLIQASTLFHHKNRITSGENIFVNLEDFFHVYSTYHPLFLENLMCKQDVEKLDWQNVWNLGTKVMIGHYPEFLESWQESNIKENKLTVYDVSKRQETTLGYFENQNEKKE